MMAIAGIGEWILGLILVLSSLGVIAAKKPVHSSLSFLVTLLTLATLYFELSARFIAIMQILVYAGAILVIFMFVIVLFQDAHAQLELHKPKSLTWFIFGAVSLLLAVLAFFGLGVMGLKPMEPTVHKDFGTVEELGRLLYIDFFFPFEAVILLFLIALVGSLYTAKKER